MPTMDDDFWTIYFVGITSLNSVLVASSYKCLLSRPIVQEVSELTYVYLNRSFNGQSLKFYKFDTLMKFS